ncbi:hypothetical protein [Nostoc sp.]|uniref:hypothetical protein n=1 Tax=Nostoc sp. TaxID=1180 RepID=UPI002FFB93F8
MKIINNITTLLLMILKKFHVNVCPLVELLRGWIVSGAAGSLEESLWDKLIIASEP